MLVYQSSAWVKCVGKEIFLFLHIAKIYALLPPNSCLFFYCWRSSFLSLWFFVTVAIFFLLNLSFDVISLFSSRLSLFSLFSRLRARIFGLRFPLPPPCIFAFSKGWSRDYLASRIEFVRHQLRRDRSPQGRLPTMRYEFFLFCALAVSQCGHKIVLSRRCAFGAIAFFLFGKDHLSTYIISLSRLHVREKEGERWEINLTLTLTHSAVTLNGAFLLWRNPRARCNSPSLVSFFRKLHLAPLFLPAFLPRYRWCGEFCFFADAHFPRKLQILILSSRKPPVSFVYSQLSASFLVSKNDREFQMMRETKFGRMHHFWMV